MTALDRLLDALPPWVLVGGKGGVGKTTCASALAARSAHRGARTLLLSTDPARSLGDALGTPLEAAPREIPGHPRLFAAQLDARRARDDFLARWRETLITIVDRGTYLDRDDIAGLIDAALPGVDEAMAMLALASLDSAGDWERLIVDTAPTGHTLRLLSLPDTFRALVQLLDTMQGKHRFMVQALTHRYRTDEADAFLDDMREQLDHLRGSLSSPSRTAVVLVTRAESLVLAETRRYAAALAGMGLRVGAIVVNAVQAEIAGSHRPADELPTGVPRLAVPLLEQPPMGLAAIEDWGKSARWEIGESSDRVEGPRGAGSFTATDASARGAPPNNDDTTALPSRPHLSAAATIHPTRHAAPPVRRLTIVGGKGGVGKTTAACAIAVAAASLEAPVLVVSTDPAPSVADALDHPVADEDTPVPHAPGLVARQMDAAAAFDRLKRDYEARIDAVFDGLLGQGMDATHDHAILRDLLALAPPGIDELYALALLGEMLGERRFATIIVDPAPTGHLLRLLEMPALALDWSHLLMRLMLKYREVAGLGDAAGEVLSFARRTRALGELLADPAQAGLVVVALDEPLVRAESERLVAAVRAHGVDVPGVLWNRVQRSPRPLPVHPPVPQFVAAATEPPPRGVAALRRWHAGWTSLALTDG